MKCNTKDIIFPLITILSKDNELTGKDLVRLSTPFEINESAVRTYLTRAVQNNIFERIQQNNKIIYRLTKRGQEFSNLVSISFHFESIGWNKQWSMIAFSVPDNARADRDKLRRKLFYCRYRQWYKGLWIRPDNLELKIEDIIRRYIDETQFSVFTGVPGELDKSREISEKIFRLGELNNMYAASFEKLIDDVERYYQQSLVEQYKGHFLLGGKFVNLLSQDPLLPNELLPTDWKGDKLRHLFQQFLKIANPALQKYYDEVKQEEL